MTSALEGSPQTQDGRVARGLRTREAILSAYEALIVSADAPPTGVELAARAGVSARSIFTHFNDMDGVLAAASRRAFQWMIESHVDIPLELSVHERLRRFAHRQADVLERTSPLYRMFRSFRQGARRESCSPAVNDVLVDVDRIRRGYIDFLFAGELNALSSPEREEAVEALVVCSSWNTWEGLRVEQHLEVPAALAVLERTLVRLL